jgi:hypothetical protein
MIEQLSGLVFRFAACAGGGSNSFLQFPTWYKYLKEGVAVAGEKCAVSFLFPTDVPLVLLALVEILLRIAGLAAIAYVVYGGVQYVTSQGEPDKVAHAKGTIINALAGMLIATLAVAFVSFLGQRLG